MSTSVPVSTYTERPARRPETIRMTRLLPLTASCTAAIIALLTTGGSAQQKVPFRGNTPIAPSGIPRIPLPDQPVIYDTAEGQKIRVVVHAERALRIPGARPSCPTPRLRSGQAA